jgi:hypothetical protein
VYATPNDDPRLFCREIGCRAKRPRSVLPLRLLLRRQPRRRGSRSSLCSPRGLGGMPSSISFAHRCRFPFFPTLSLHPTPTPAGERVQARCCERGLACVHAIVFPVLAVGSLVRSRRDLRGAKGELPHFRGGEDRLRILKLAGISISPRAHSGGTSPASSSSPANRSRSCGYAS